jgi:ceramide glucosyltransferase
MVSFLYLIATFSLESVIVFNVVSLIKILFDLKMANSVGSDLKWSQYLLIPLKDIIIGFIWFVPFFYNKIDWRGNSFFISRGTKLKPAGQ